MLNTLLLTLTLATSPETAHADQSTAIVARAQAECWTLRECRVAHELAAAARAEQDAAEALATTHPLHAPVDPWQSDYAEPFADLDPVPDATEAQAALELSSVQDRIDGLVTP